MYREFQRDIHESFPPSDRPDSSRVSAVDTVLCTTCGLNTTQTGDVPCVIRLKIWLRVTTEVLIVRGKERATKRWFISDEIRWLKGKQTRSGIYFRFSKPDVVFRRQSWRSNRLGTGLLSMKHVWLPVEQMMSRVGSRAQTGSRNIAVMAEIDPSTPTFCLSPIARMDLFTYLYL